jgi:hypothetical protein
MQAKNIPFSIPKGMCISNYVEEIHPYILPENMNKNNMGFKGQLPESFQHIMSNVYLHGNMFTGNLSCKFLKGMVYIFWYRYSAKQNIKNVYGKTYNWTSERITL